MSDLMSEHLIRLAKMAEGTGKHQEAYNFYVRVLEEHPDHAEAWLGKAIETGWLSNATHFRLPEMCDCVRHALELTDESARPAVAAQTAEALNLIARAGFKSASKSLAEFARVDDNWAEYMQQSMGILDTLKYANELAPANQGIIKNFIRICFANIEGISYEDKFDRDDNGFVKTKVSRLPREHQKFFQREMAAFVDKRRAVDPTYKPPAIRRPATTWVVGVLIGLAVISSAGWAVYCAMPAKIKDTRVVNPGVSAFTKSFIIDGLDRSYGVNTCKILYVDTVPGSRFEVTGQVQPAGQNPVTFQLTVRYHPESTTLSGRYIAESAPRFEIPMRFSQ